MILPDSNTMCHKVNEFRDRTHGTCLTYVKCICRGGKGVPKYYGQVFEWKGIIYFLKKEKPFAVIVNQINQKSPGRRGECENG
jgi:hypothetical protein